MIEQSILKIIKKIFQIKIILLRNKKVLKLQIEV